MIPQTKTALTDETDIANMRKILDLLDESDDVQNVYTNLDGDLDD
jgi:transcriptional/translational regulatory protein YebC/TACO1